MTATHSVVPGRILEAGIFPPEPMLSAGLQRSINAIDRSAEFWADGAPGEALPAVGPPRFGDDPCRRAAWLMRRPAGRPVAVAVESDVPARFVELRGADELALAHRVAAEAFGIADAEFAPRRLTLQPEPLHLRTWALFWDSRVLSCALSVVVGDVMVWCAVATQPALQGRGLGSRIVRELHQLHERTGMIREFVACPRPAAVPRFERLGYDLVMNRQVAAAG
jgi:GNAT superfamily N-acetyltransferase